MLWDISSVIMTTFDSHFIFFSGALVSLSSNNKIFGLSNVMVNGIHVSVCLLLYYLLWCVRESSINWFLSPSSWTLSTPDLISFFLCRSFHKTLFDYS